MLGVRATRRAFLGVSIAVAAVLLAVTGCGASGGRIAETPRKASTAQIQSVCGPLRQRLIAAARAPTMRDPNRFNWAGLDSASERAVRALGIAETELRLQETTDTGPLLTALRMVAQRFRELGLGGDLNRAAPDPIVSLHKYTALAREALRICSTIATPTRT